MNLHWDVNFKNQIVRRKIQAVKFVAPPPKTNLCASEKPQQPAWPAQNSIESINFLTRSFNQKRKKMASGAPAINLKINWGDDIRRITLLHTPSYAELRKTFQKIFSVAGLPKGFVIKYQDDEKDLVTIGSDLELSEALQFGLKQQSPLRLSIHESKSASKQDIVNEEAGSVPLPQPAFQSGASSQLPDLSQLIALIEQLPNNQDLKRGLESAVNSLGPLFHNVGQSLQHAVENNRYSPPFMKPTFAICLYQAISQTPA